ncbi:hypothetical protein [Streptomyces ipomoeae]|uniref:hypothetical protein n=1 Tax=Streptomyces ipomoeae TaxID=103232 RepID=UPI00215CDCFD|nr:hypothetical protein [Streptomyces ipomoeae]
MTRRCAGTRTTPRCAWLSTIAHKRATIVRLRDERHIDDTVLRRLQADLDNEEVRLTGTATAE